MKIAMVVVLLYFRFLDAIESRYANASGIVATIMMLLPSIVLAVAIAVMNNLYLRLATFLTEWGEYGNAFSDVKKGCEASFCRRVKTYGWGHFVIVIILGKTLYFYNTSLHPGR